MTLITLVQVCPKGGVEDYRDLILAPVSALGRKQTFIARRLIYLFSIYWQELFHKILLYFLHTPQGGPEIHGGHVFEFHSPYGLLRQ